MRRTLSAADAKNRLSDALRQAENGDLVVITRYRKPVAALVDAGRLEQLERADAGEASNGDAGGAHPVGDAGQPSGDGPAEATADRGAKELRQRAAAGSLRRIDYDLARLPERLKPVLRLIRANLFRPRITVERIQATLDIAGHDLTTEFRLAAGASIHKYLTDRRLECTARLLVDTDLSVAAIARLVGYGRTEGLARAFKKRHGVRPPIYRELKGELSLEVASNPAADRTPLAPRHLAGHAALPSGSRCGGCGKPLQPAPAVRVFEDLTPLCDDCGRERAPELDALLAPS